MMVRAAMGGCIFGGVKLFLHLLYTSRSVNTFFAPMENDINLRCIIDLLHFSSLFPSWVPHARDVKIYVQLHLYLHLMVVM